MLCNVTADGLFFVVPSFFFRLPLSHRNLHRHKRDVQNGIIRVNRVPTSNILFLEI